MTPKWRSFDHSIIRRDDAIKGHLCILADERTVVVACNEGRFPFCDTHVDDDDGP